MKVYDEIDERHREFIASQHMFFVATAPLAAEGHVNLSPKGLESFTVLDARRVAYLDLGGSGAETHAHVRENGRICLMFCAFEDKPLILRLYGRGRAHQFGSEAYDALRDRFPAITVPSRGIIEIEISRIQDSCGWGVPFYEFKGDRRTLADYNAKSSQEDYMARRIAKNATSIDGLPALERR